MGGHSRSRFSIAEVPDEGGEPVLDRGERRPIVAPAPHGTIVNRLAHVAIARRGAAAAALMVSQDIARPREAEKIDDPPCRCVSVGDQLFVTVLEVIQAEVRAIYARLVEAPAAAVQPPDVE